MVSRSSVLNDKLIQKDYENKKVRENSPIVYGDKVWGLIGCQSHNKSHIARKWSTCSIVKPWRNGVGRFKTKGMLNKGLVLLHANPVAGPFKISSCHIAEKNPHTIQNVKNCLAAVVIFSCCQMQKLITLYDKCHNRRKWCEN